MKNRFLNITILVLVLIGIVGIIFGATGLSAARVRWDSCNKVNGECYYPGACHDYSDSNKDGICDRSQPDPAVAAAVVKTTTPSTTTKAVVTTGAANTVTATAASSNTPTSTPSAVAAAGQNGGTTEAIPEGSIAENKDVESQAAAPIASRFSYYLLPILLVSAALYAFTWILAARKKITLAVHRKIWNMALLIYALVSCLLGVLLVVRIETGFEVPLPFDMLFWHVEAGIAMSIVAVFHVIWHRKYFARLFSGMNKSTSV